MSSLLTRRRALQAALALLAVPRFARAEDPRFVSDPFTLGVGSGWPTPTGISLWTRLAPSPLSPDGGMTPGAVVVAVEVAEDEAFTTIVATTTVGAYPELAHSVHVDVDGLGPGRWYYYRFHAGAATSPIGRTRTADAPDAVVQRLRFAIASCQHFEQGWYGAYRHLVDEDLDLMVFLGDYLYESTWGENLVRRYVGSEAITVDDYRIRHAQHKLDPDLQRMHGHVPWLMTWDDHEVDNDWAADQSEHLDPAFLVRRASAFQAYFEHVPLPGNRRRTGADLQLYGQVAFGDLARFCVLDDRQYRSHQACPSPLKGGGSNTVDDGTCAELDDPARTLLGAEQERWLDQALANTTQRWNVIGQQTLFSPVDADPAPGGQTWTDGWSGYPEARERLLGVLKKRKPNNPVIVGGDVHATYVADVYLDPGKPAVATEFCGTSVTSEGMSKEESDQRASDNPQFALVDGWHRGYLAFELTPASCTARVRAVDTARRDAGVETVATFVVQDGEARANRSS